MKQVVVWMILSILMITSVAGVNITIESSQSDAEYAAYKLLAAEDLGGDKYDYTVNEKYRDILTEVTGKTDDEAIVDYISGLDTEDMIYFANEMYAKLKDSEPDADSSGKVFTGVESGYYLIANKASTIASVVILDTAGKDDITIQAKENVPSVILKISNYNVDSDTIVGWYDAVDAMIGEEVKVKLECEVPENFTKADNCNLDIFCDTSEGVELKYSTSDDYVSDDDFSNVTVKLVNSVDSTDKIIFQYNTSDDGYVSISKTAEGIKVNIQNIANVYSVFNFDSIVIETSAKLKENAAADVSGNPITAYVQYPRESGSSVTDTSAIDKVSVFTYKLVLNNYDGKSNPLNGAGYELSKDIGGGQYKVIGNVTLTDSNIFEFLGLSSGSYKLEQILTPEGYNKLPDMTFTITGELETESDDPKLVSITVSDPDKITVSGAVLNIDIHSRSGIKLPSTGGVGDTLFYILALPLIAASIALFSLSRKVI
ncbi:MAG: LPXTG cell wall anchor domain-containing protein [Clostridiales bacterium]|nr:LPXTG cell wall anchor domain-containing protein [Clostridiales bacterium]